MFLSICNTPEVLEVMRIVKIIIDIIKIVVPIMLIISLMITFMAAVSGKVDDDLPKALKLSVNKIFAAILIFLIPTVVSIIFSVLDANSVDYAACLNNANAEKINEAYVYRAQRFVQTANEKLTRSSYNAAKRVVLKIKNDSDRKDLQNQLEIVYKKIEKYEKEDVQVMLESLKSEDRFIYPLKDYQAALTACFDGNDETHRGAHGAIDIGAPANTPVYAAKSGIVTAVEKNIQVNCFDLSASGYGNFVVIDHQDGTTSLYGHMYPGTVKVNVNDVVKQGDKIGEVGSTGNSTGYHLHFEVTKNNARVDPIPLMKLNVTNPNFCS